MSLPAGERWKLRKIERSIRRADPRLAALYSVFSWISRLEKMPRMERLSARIIRREARARREAAFRSLI